jgi:long-chain acyl-CoA synthetase
MSNTPIQCCFHLLDLALAKGNKPDHFAAKEGGNWIQYSTNQVVDLVNHLSYGLLNLGVKPSDKIALIANNRPEWCIADYAIQQVGGVSVPIYATISADDTAYIFKDCGLKYAFVSTEELYHKAADAAQKAGLSVQIFMFDKVGSHPHWLDLVTDGRNNPAPEALNNSKASIQTSSLLTIIYTSGTTGNPKGVMLSHSNVLSNIEGSSAYVPVKDGDKALSFLPLCHIYERMLCYLYQRFGVGIWFAENMDTISDNLKEVKPEIFTTVPRLLEKVYDKIVLKGRELSGIKKAMFFWALNLGLEYDVQGRNSAWYNLQLSIARKLVFSKWQEALGGNLIAIVCGSAALQPRLCRVFRAAGIDVMEGYGLTETSPVISVNWKQPEGVCLGTVGRLIDGVEVKFAPDGEILVKGPNIMLGYFNKPELTAEAMTEDGYFKTGDIGEWIDGIFLKITDRKKEIFKTSNGKYIAPQKNENLLKESMFIEQCMVVGEGERYVAALIVPNIDSLKNWCKIKGIEVSNNSLMLANEQVITKLNAEIEICNTQLGQFEQIKKIAIMPLPWTIESGELTPTMKLKRKYIQQKYQDQITALFE